jgi:hypothetical protein
LHGRPPWAGRIDEWRGSRWARACGLALAAYAVVVYPLWGAASEPGYPAMPLFGITPCPLTLFTFGMALLLRVRMRLMVIPVLWALVGGSAAFLLQVPQDWPLLLSPLVLLLARARPESRV